MTTVAQATGDDDSATSRHECRICWYVYDPAEGDPQEQVPPGTAFGDLPDHWRCPQCDSKRQVFLLIVD